MYYMEHSIAIYKYVFNHKYDQYRSELQIILRTSTQYNILKMFRIESFDDGQPLKSLCITNEEALYFVAPNFEKNEEYFMVISDDQDHQYPITTVWHNIDTSSKNDFDNPCIIKEITSNKDFWKQAWNFLNMEV